MRIAETATDLVFAIDGMSTIVDVEVVVTVQLEVVEPYHEPLQRSLRLSGGAETHVSRDGGDSG